MAFSSTAILDRLRLRMPLVIRLTDPLSGKPFEVQRDNVLALLVVDFSNIVLELQTVAVLYGEMARIAAAAKYAKEQADLRLRVWKAKVIAEAQAKAAKPLADHAKQDVYRAHVEYGAMYGAVHEAEILVGLAEDMKTAFELKSHALGHLSKIDFGHTRVEASDDRLAEMSRQLEEELLPGMREAAAAAEQIRKTSGRTRRAAPPPEEAP